MKKKIDIPPPPPLPAKNFPVMRSTGNTQQRSSLMLPTIITQSAPNVSADSHSLKFEQDLCLGSKEKLIRNSSTVQRTIPVSMPSLDDFKNLQIDPSAHRFYQKRSFTDIPSLATDLLRLPPPPPSLLNESRPPPLELTPTPRHQPSCNTLSSVISDTRSISSSPTKAMGTPSGGWLSGYVRDVNPHLPEIPHDMKLKHTERKNPPPLQHIDSSSSRSFNLSHSELQLHRHSYSSTQYQPQSRRVSLMKTDRPRLDTGDPKVEVDLADILEGKKELAIDGLNGVRYEIDGCVGAFESGFVLLATKIRGRKKKKVYIKMVHRKSDAYKSVQMNVNPCNTELALMKSGAAKHLPEYVSHLMEDEYLIMVAKTHGVKKNSFMPFTDKYHEVPWVYWFNTSA